MCRSCTRSIKCLRYIDSRFVSFTISIGRISNHWCPGKTQPNQIIAFPIKYGLILSTTKKRTPVYQKRLNRYTIKVNIFYLLCGRGSHSLPILNLPVFAAADRPAWLRCGRLRRGRQFLNVELMCRRWKSLSLHLHLHLHLPLPLPLSQSPTQERL